MAGSKTRRPCWTPPTTSGISPMQTRSDVTNALGNLPADDPGAPRSPQPRTARRHARRLHPATQRSGRRAMTLLALLPLSIVLAVKGAHLVGDPILNAYGIVVLVSTM